MTESICLALSIGILLFFSIKEAREGLDLFRSSERDFYTFYNIKQKKDILDYSTIINFLKEKKGEAICNKFSYLDYQNKKIINKSSALNLNDKIKIKFYDGNAEGKITKINQDKES